MTSFLQRFETRLTRCGRTFATGRAISRFDLDPIYVDLLGVYHGLEYRKPASQSLCCLATILALVGAQSGLAQVAAPTPSKPVRAEQPGLGHPHANQARHHHHRRELDLRPLRHLPAEATSRRHGSEPSFGEHRQRGRHAGPEAISKAIQSSASELSRLRVDPAKHRVWNVAARPGRGPAAALWLSIARTGSPATNRIATRLPTSTKIINLNVENGLPPDYYQYLLTGGTGQTQPRRAHLLRWSRREQSAARPVPADPDDTFGQNAL